MSDRFQPVSMEQLTAWAFDELENKGSLFGVPRSAFFVPTPDDRFRIHKYGKELETPFGVAAGPHSQMAQNIVVAWLCGSRFIELKTVQTLDELEVNKPCIDLEDEGYNVEWSQELKVHESFDEYLRAWILIHALHHKLGFPGDGPGMIFNMSVGYNLEGIRQPNVQWFLDVMNDCSEYKQEFVDVVARWYPEVREIEIPDRISDTITLSTMHGCPPDEIEKIGAYLLEERGLHTSIKCNPTLLGADRVRSIINEELGYIDITVPDEAFGHDLVYADAVPMLERLQEQAEERDLTFGIKLTNTLEVINTRQAFDRDEMMYLSGRALHAVTINLAHTLVEEFRGELLISFAGGADCFNVPDLLRSGMASVTVCSDLLKSGGYLRMLQYFETLEAAMDEVGAASLADYICRSALASEEFEELPGLLDDALPTTGGPEMGYRRCEQLAERLGTGDGPQPIVDEVRAWAVERRMSEDDVATLVSGVVTALGRINLELYAHEARSEWRSRKSSLRTDRSKTARPLGLFDCIEAPCVDECPVDQKVPQYMDAVRRGDFAEAVAITREDNPLPSILGQVCDHLCENTCIRTHYDQPLAIRDIKRFIMNQESAPHLVEGAAKGSARVAIIGAGPAGLAAAEKLAYAGLDVVIFEMYPYAGGMVGGAIPSYRLPKEKIDQDLAVLERLGVEIRYSMRAGVDFTLAELREDGFSHVFVAVGAQLAKRLGLPGEEADGVMDALKFLRSVREGDPVPLGRRVGVIGAGDTAMDCVRSAFRLGSEVSLIYRRTIDQMPADREEIEGAVEEGVDIVELAKPTALNIDNDQLAGLVCTRMEYRGDRDESGRKIPHEIEESDFEIPLDTLILAISQHSVLDFFDEEPPELSDRGYIQVDPESFATSVPGVFAGGDVAAPGPSSIVKAAADGKRVAESILAAVGVAETAESGTNGFDEEFDLDALLLRRAKREWRVATEHTPLHDRKNFEQPILAYTEEQAIAEASRCLDCHKICSLCVGVCPNLALMTYESEPLTVDLPILQLQKGELVEVGSEQFRADQRHQIAVLTDFCNECGNCVTFCPTSGEPYRDKPRLYLDRAEFEAQSENAFMLLHDGDTVTIEARSAGLDHRLTLGSEIHYQSPEFTARLDPNGLDLLAVESGPSIDEGQAVSLETCATMFALLRSLEDSMPHLPRVHSSADAAAETRVAHPGYAESS